MAISPLSSVKNKGIFGFCFVLLALMQYLVLTRMGFDYREVVLDSLVSSGMMAVSVLLTIFTFSIYRPQTYGLAFLIVFCLVITFLATTFTGFLLKNIFIREESYRLFIGESFLIRWFFAIPVNVAGAFVSVIWYNSEELKEREQRKKETEMMSREAELFKLRQQLQPHFLFNSLNSISALTVTDPEKAREMIYRLSEFLRGTLKNEDSKFVLLKEEFRYLELYLEIEKLRFGHRLDTVFDNEDEALNKKLPTMLLQPVVENAIKFGLYDTLGKVTISIQAKSDNNYLYITVTNPYDPETASPKGTGFGLSSLKRRLYLLYGRNDLLTTAKEDRTFIIHIKIPQYDQGSNN